MEDHTIAYIVFDLIYYNGYDLSHADLLSRKELLKNVVSWNNEVRYSDHVVGRGEELFKHAEKLGVEGIIAKRSDSTYVQSRSSNWLKIKTTQRQEVVIVGYTQPRRSRTYFGSLVLGLYRGGKLIPVGHVGTGFNHATLKQLYDLMQPLKTETSPLAEPFKTNDIVQWVKPKLVAEIKFSEWTNDLSMRHPVFLGLRDDKKPEDSTLEKKLHTEEVVVAKPARKSSRKKEAVNDDSSKVDSKPVSGETAFKGKLRGDLKVKVPGGVVSLTNLDKVYWPDDGYTKGDLLRYYYEMAPTILPYLKDRPIILKRYPDGIKGFSFHQHTVKDPPEFVKTYKRLSDGDTVTYAICNNVASLLYVANLGSISIHAWSARMTAPEKPDWILFDLDPGSATFAQVREVALHVKGILDSLGLECYPKTSGSKGLHVYVPIKAAYTHDQVVQFATLIAHRAAAERPDLIAVERMVRKRKKGRVYLDYLQNGFGKSLAAAYSVRARVGATVSTPLEWREVKSAKLRVESFTIRNVGTRVKRKGDLFAEVLKKKQSLAKAIAKLEKLMSAETQP
jgi:bifunctional non-homologous end joining protein LigD